ncbi:MAG TPA: hypothetical protein VF893_04650 [Candidatus Bathyarchaeia archaeon]
MFNRTKKYKAAINWHSRAMLVDPRKTRLTIINGERPELPEGSFMKETIDAPATFNIAALLGDDFSEHTEIMDEDFGTPVSFMLVDE